MCLIVVSMSIQEDCVTLKLTALFSMRTLKRVCGQITEILKVFAAVEIT